MINKMETATILQPNCLWHSKCFRVDVYRINPSAHVLF
jgi:hypothetical protein